MRTEPRTGPRTGPGYRPQQRAVAVAVLTTLGWVEGTLAVPRRQSVVDFLDGSGAFIKLARVRLPGRAEPAPFLALQRGAVSLIVPRDGADGVETEGGRGTCAPLEVACLFPGGALEGRLGVLVNLRLSDYLRQPGEFLVLHEARWRPSQTPADVTDVTRTRQTLLQWPCALVNTARLVAIEERGPHGDSGHAGQPV